MVVDFTTTRLNDEDILAADTFLDLHSGLAALELVEKHLGLGYAEVVADSLCELGVRGSAENDNVPHLEGWWTR